MTRRLPYTPNSHIKNALRRLWLFSRERREALKNTGNCCSVCGVKASQAKGREVKLEVHHLDGCKWDEAIQAIRECILHKPERLCPLCTDCHKGIDQDRK